MKSDFALAIKVRDRMRKIYDEEESDYLMDLCLEAVKIVREEDLADSLLEHP